MNSIPNLSKYLKTPPPSDIESVKFIIFRKEVYPVYLYKDGLYRDLYGTIFGYADDDYYLKPLDNKCGIGNLSLKDGHPLNIYCAPHDFMYSSFAWQLFHTRSEADEYLKNLVELGVERHDYNKKVPTLFKNLSRIFGRFASWQNKTTKNM